MADLGDNFSMLNASWPSLTAAASTAETNANRDPMSAAVQLRLFVERLVKDRYRRWNLPLPAIQPTLFDLTRADLFRHKLPDRSST